MVKPVKVQLGGATATLRLGQRVSRKTTDELGTVIETDGQIKVKWDGGRTSYFSRYKPANVRLRRAIGPTNTCARPKRP